jgi:hypothetical protein
MPANLPLMPGCNSVQFCVAHVCKTLNCQVNVALKPFAHGLV